MSVISVSRLTAEKNSGVKLRARTYCIDVRGDVLRCPQVVTNAL